MSTSYFAAWQFLQRRVINVLYETMTEMNDNAISKPVTLKLFFSGSMQQILICYRFKISKGFLKN